MSPKFIHTALFTVLAVLGLHCQTPMADKAGFVYENEYGSLHILPQNKAHKRVIYSNNNGDKLDTLLEINPKMKLVPQDSAFPFLSLRMGGVEWNANCARIWEFSSMAFLGQFIHIEQMYERPFYRTGEPITVTGYLTQGKGGAQIDGIYLKDFTGSELRYATVRGTVHKKPYPREYYSTDDSPQGMFSDNKVHYRLVMENYEIEKLQVRRMTGYALNVGGQAHFVWEFADSESYRLEGREAWTKAEEHPKITVEGILLQNEMGSVLMDWKMVK